jgi:hypothetical protein
MISAPNGSAHCRTEPLNREPGDDYTVSPEAKVKSQKSMLSRLDLTFDL